MRRHMSMALVSALVPGLFGPGLMAHDQPASSQDKAAAVAGAMPENRDRPTTPVRDEWTTEVAVDTLWVLVAGFLVFFMHAGFGCVESGFCRSKNTVNILGKNLVVFGISSIAFWAIGFALMFGNGVGVMGTTGWFVGVEDTGTQTAAFEALNRASIPLLAKFFFQLMLAAAAATIVSGCVAERMRYVSFMIFTLLLVGVSYPITGHWVWGGGWLVGQGFRDFAGSTVVHSVSGWAGLAGILVLGPRLGKYSQDGTVLPIPGHSMTLVFLGGLALWLGWFGFNPGSTMAVSGSSAHDVAHIVVITNLACAAGLISATTVSWLKLGVPDFSMTVNGALAGLVAISAPCLWVSAVDAIIIGAIGGVLVVYSVLCFDRFKIDDPVGALSVHLTNGIWGTLAVGFFAAGDLGNAGPEAGLFHGGGATQLVKQAIGVVAVGAFTFILSYVGWKVLEATMGIRVTEDEERRGLDLSQMGMEAYPGDVVS